MINLQKGPKPAILEAKAQDWLKAIVEKKAKGETPTASDLQKYNHKDIKAALIEETNGKCAYCESKFLHVTFGDIEHITPKKLGDEYRYEWSNLTLACDVCNTYKGSKENIVDPYSDDIPSMFVFFGAFVFAKPGKDKAFLTETLLKLNRIKLIEKRGEEIARINKLVLLANAMKDESDREIFLADILDHELSDAAEFAAACRSFFRHLVAEQVIPDPSRD